MTTEPDGVPIADDRPPALRLRVETLSVRPGPQTVEAFAEAVDDDSGLGESTDAAGRRRLLLVRGVTVDVDTTEPYLFGRRSVATIRLGLDLASQKHAVVRQDSDGLFLDDPGSQNGTFVNGARIHRVWLKRGDLVHFEFGPHTRLMCRVLLGERPVLEGACRHGGWVILDGSTTVPGCRHRAFRRIDQETIETGTAVATGPVERFATPSQVAPATGFRITADGAGIPAPRLLEMVRTGSVDVDLKAAIDAITADHADDAINESIDEAIDLDGRCFRWTGDHGVQLPLTHAERAAVAAAVAGLLPGLVERHRRLVAELAVLDDDDVAAVPVFRALPDP